MDRFMGRWFPARPIHRPTWLAIKLPSALLITVLFLLAPVRGGAILQRAGEHVHDAGVFRLFMTNLGVLGNPTYPSFSDHPSLEWPAGSANEFLLEAGLWVGARDRVGDLIGVSTSAPVSEFRPSLDPIDRIYASFDGDIGARRLGTTGLVEQADDDGDDRYDEEFLNGKDDDGDGLIDEDFLAFGSQTFACEYRDDTPEARAQLLTHEPQLLEVRQLSFTWAEGVPDLERCAVIRYEVINDGDGPLYDVYLGFYVDPDVGPKARDNYWRDDRYAIETITGTFPAEGYQIIGNCAEVPFELPVVTMEDVPDDEPGAGGGDAPGLIGVALLDHTTNKWGFRAPETVAPSAIVHLRGRASLDRNREEIADSQKYDLMASGAFMGNAHVADHRFVLVAGPFSVLPAGESLHFSVALMVAEDADALRQTVTTLMHRFHGRWSDLDGSSRTGRSGRETCLTSEQAGFCNFTPFLVDHDCDEPQTSTFLHAGCRNRIIQTLCPTVPGGCSQRRQVFWREYCIWTDFDCNRCTPNVSGGETLVRWADIDTRISAQPIGRRIATGDHQVMIEWDNAAELPTAAGTLPSVVGYRVWRAEGWTRPPGSSGPTDDEWRLVAELPLPASGLPEPPTPFIVEGVAAIDSIPGPADSLYAHFEIGRYAYVDTDVLNGYALFYDVTPFTLEEQPGGTMEVRSLGPRGRAGDEVYPTEASTAVSEIRVVPNPYVTGAAWDLEPNRSDPSGRKMAFVGLPPAPGRIEIFTLAGDRVRVLEHSGATGTVYWDLMSRNGQPVVAGVYVYVFAAAGMHKQGKLVIVR